jgi:hypothetical protein
MRQNRFLRKLTEGDTEFQFWSHMQIMVYGEAHFHQFQLELMQESHWLGLSKFLTNYIDNEGFRDFWDREKHSFSKEYCAWINDRLTAKES